MGGRGGNGSRNASSQEERPIDESITKRALKNHVTATLKKAGLPKVKTYSTAIRGYRAVSQPGFDWGEEYGGINPPHITYVGGLHVTAERSKAFMDKVEAALSENFKIKRDNWSISILGEYERRN